MKSSPWINPLGHLDNIRQTVRCLGMMGVTHRHGNQLLRQLMACLQDSDAVWHQTSAEEIGLTSITICIICSVNRNLHFISLWWMFVWKNVNFMFWSGRPTSTVRCHFLMASFLNMTGETPNDTRTKKCGTNLRSIVYKADIGRDTMAQW